MISRFHLILTVAVAAAMTSCAPKSGSSIRAHGKSNPNPQVTDILKGKSTVEKMNIKYGGPNGQLEAKCVLSTEKKVPAAPTPVTPPPEVPNQNEPATSVAAFTVKPTGFLPPIEQPTPDMVKYNLRSQAEVDKDLMQPIEVTLQQFQNGKSVTVLLTFEPLKIEESLSFEIGRVKYIMKHSPVLQYKYSIEVEDKGTITRSSTALKIYEKVLTKELLAQTQIDSEYYQHFLSCTLNTTINDSDEELAREFQGQWRCIDCLGPQTSNVQ